MDVYIPFQIGSGVACVRVCVCPLHSSGGHSSSSGRNNDDQIINDSAETDCPVLSCSVLRFAGEEEENKRTTPLDLTELRYTAVVPSRIVAMLGAYYVRTYSVAAVKTIDYYSSIGGTQKEEETREAKRRGRLINSHCVDCDGARRKKEKQRQCVRAEFAF